MRRMRPSSERSRSLASPSFSGPILASPMTTRTFSSPTSSCHRSSEMVEYTALSSTRRSSCPPNTKWPQIGETSTA